MLKLQIFVNFFIRAVIGMGIIFFVNLFLERNGMDVKVGFNAISLLATGMLGLPGVAMLYGIVFLAVL